MADGSWAKQRKKRETIPLNLGYFPVLRQKLCLGAYFFAKAGCLAAIYSIKSTTLLEYPHSLSYQETTLTKVSLSAMPAPASNIEVRLSPLKSDETTWSSV